MIVGCDYCGSRHGDLFLCKPAKRVLDVLKSQRMDMTAENLRFPTLVPEPGADYTLVRQLTVDAVLVPVGAMKWPGLVLGGQDWFGAALPPWLLPGSAGDLRQTCRLVQSQTEKAIKKAKEA